MVPVPPALLFHDTRVTPMLSVAVPPRITVPVGAMYVVRVVGVMIVTIGFVVSGVMLLTMIVAPVEVARFPAASRATARTVWKPLVADSVFQLVEYGEVVSSAPRFTLSSLN